MADDEPHVFTDADLNSYTEDVSWVDWLLAQPTDGWCWDRAHKVKALVPINH